MDIKNVTVAGGGVLGSQIAFQAAFHDFDVTLYDISDDAIDKASKNLESLKDRYKEDLDASQDKVDKTYDSIQLTSELEDAVSQADIVIEAIPETLDIKTDFYTSLADVAPENTIFATNTSTLTPSDFKEATKREDRFLALHFANEVWNFNTAEVMGTEDTSEETYNTVVDFAEAMGMVSIPIKKEQPGYIQNSLLVPYLHAGEYLFVDDIADPHTIDKTWMKATNSEFGPFSAIDTIGLNTSLNIVKNDYEKDQKDWQKKYMDKLQERIDDGKTGKAAGEGFYKYPNPLFEQEDFFNNPEEICNLTHGFNNVTVAGGGVLGSQIAFQVATGGFNVSLYDISDEAVEAAKNRVSNIKPQYKDDMNASDSDVDEIEGRISFFSDLQEAVKDADLVIEVVPENIKIKRSFYSDLRDVVPEKTIIASNTSTLKPSDFEEDTGRPEQFGALHFANHVWKNNTGEVMPGSKTTDDTYNKLLAFARDIHLVVLPVRREQPGYILNTLLVPFLNAGLDLNARGVAEPELIDKTWMIATGAPMGPFGIIDNVGLNTTKNIKEAEYEQTNDETDKKIVDLLQEKIDKGETGINEGKGFYDYSDGIPYNNPDFLK